MRMRRLNAGGQRERVRSARRWWVLPAATLVLWIAGAPHAQANLLQLAAELDAENSTSETRPGPPALATDGASYLVVSCRTPGFPGPGGPTASGLIGVRVSLSGAVLGELVIAPHSCDNFPRPAVTFDGTDFLVVYRGTLDGGGFGIRGVRVSPSGTVLDAGGGFEIAPDGNDPDVAFDGSHYLVVWNRFTGSTTGHDLFAARITTGGQVLGPFAISERTGNEVHATVAFAGGVYLVAWRGPNGNDTGVWAARVSPQGTVLDTDPVAVATGAGSKEVPDLATDGVNFIAVWVEASGLGGPFNRIAGRRIDPHGALLDGDAASAGIVINTSSPDKTNPAVAFDGVDYVIVKGWRSAR